LHILYRDGAWFRPIIINETRLLMSGEVYLVLHSLLQQFSAKGFFIGIVRQDGHLHSSQKAVPTILAGDASREVLISSDLLPL